MFVNRLVVIRKAKEGDLKLEPESTGKLTKDGVEAHLQHIDLIVENIVKENGLFNTEHNYGMEPGVVTLWAKCRKEIANRVGSCLRKQEVGKRELSRKQEIDPYSSYGSTEIRLRKSKTFRK